jgi:hypothetical protein
MASGATETGAPGISENVFGTTEFFEPVFSGDGGKADFGLAVTFRVLVKGTLSL